MILCFFRVFTGGGIADKQCKPCLGHHAGSLKQQNK